MSQLEERKQESFRMAEDKHWKARNLEWDNEKKQILSKLLGGGDGGLNFSTEVLEQSASTTFMTGDSTMINSQSSMSAIDLNYAKQLHIYTDQIINGGVSCDLVALCLQGADKMKLPGVVTMWKMVKFMCDVPLHESSVLKSRDSPSFLEALVNQGRNFLEENFLDYMKSCVFEHPHLAQPGGKLGTLSLVKSFLKIATNYMMQDDDDMLDDGLPLWSIVFHCLRCGDLEAACTAVEQYEHLMPEFVAWLREYQHDGKLSATHEGSLRVYYKKEVHLSNNPYKIAVFSIVGRCDIAEVHGEVAKTTEDYLWLKLSQVMVEEGSSSAPQDSLSLIRLQKMLSEEYGEAHFGANSDPLLYFKVLFLTCQFEAAIEFLFRSEQFRTHAVHVAIALHSKNLLLSSSSLHPKLLTHEGSDQISLSKADRLNVATLVLLYTRKFKLTDPREALNYYYTLRHMKSPDGGESLFQHCTSQLVRECEEYEMLLGKLNLDGSRKPGAVDKYCGGDTKHLIAKIAADTEKKGSYEDAVVLNDLCGEHDKTIQLLNRLLCGVVKYSDSRDPNRLRVKNLAIGIAERYRSQAITTNRDLRLTFHLLLDLCSFFDLYHSEKTEKALDVINQLQILPTNTDQVPNKVEEFKLQPDEVRQNISEILIATMMLLARQCNQQRSLNRSVINTSADTICSGARNNARALITFAGMLPYHLPGDTTSRLVRLEVQMN